MPSPAPSTHPPHQPAHTAAPHRRRLTSSSSSTQVQNPPSLPVLPLVWLTCKLRRCRMVVDWHNTGSSILAMRLGHRHFAVGSTSHMSHVTRHTSHVTRHTSARAIRSDYTIASSDTSRANATAASASAQRCRRRPKPSPALKSRPNLILSQSSLQRNWRVPPPHPLVFHDRPPSKFRALNCASNTGDRAEKQTVLNRLLPLLKSSCVTVNCVLPEQWHEEPAHASSGSKASKTRKTAAPPPYLVVSSAHPRIKRPHRFSALNSLFQAPLGPPMKISCR